MLELFTEFVHFDDGDDYFEQGGGDGSGTDPPDSNSNLAFAPLQKLPDPCTGREIHASALSRSP